MILHRQRGLISLYKISVSAIAALWFLFLGESIECLPFISLSPDVNVLSYSMAAGAGIFLGSQTPSRFAFQFESRAWLRAAKISLKQTFIVSFTLSVFVFATKDAAMSRIFLAHYLTTLWVVLVIVNRLLPDWLSKVVFHECHRVRTLMVGRGVQAAKLAVWLRGKERLGINLVGLLSEDSPGGEGSPKWLGRPSDLATVILNERVNQVVLLDVTESGTKLVDVFSTCQVSGCRLLIYSDVLERLPVAMSSIFDDGMLFLMCQEEPLEDPRNRLIKRLFDIALSLPVVLFVLPPLSFWVWVMQRIQSPGPLFFSRPRGGQQGHEFSMLKFRSMRAAQYDPKLESRQASPGDSRIYPFGHFLRRTSLDEFPQFWNVLKGEMSIVGPRPHLPQHDSEFSSLAKSYRTRQLVKPGITGLAQIRGLRGEITVTELLHLRVKADIEYISSWSIWLDVQITLRTVLDVVSPPESAH